MSLPASIPDAIIETVLGQLTLLFLAAAKGDALVARHAAATFLAAYHPGTEAELALAAEIISFGFHVRQSLLQAAEPDRPLNQVQRLRGAAASLGREAYRRLVMLEHMQRARNAPQAEPDVAAALEPAAEAPAAAAVETPRPAASSMPSYAHLSKEAIRRMSPAAQKRAYLERMTDMNRRRLAEQAAALAQQNAQLGAAAAG
jgi:PHD/YefM family antitoxin component YafN of YafNO toxin-antitoxin module